MWPVSYYPNINIFQWNQLYEVVRGHICKLCCGQKLTLKPENAIRIYFQGGSGHVYCQDIWWPVSDYAASSFYPLKSETWVLILLEYINIFAICDQSDIMECSGTSHIIWETGHTNLWPVQQDCVHFNPRLFLILGSFLVIGSNIVTALGQ